MPSRRLILIDENGQREGRPVTGVETSLGRSAENKLVYFMSIDSARFRKPVVPGDTLNVHVYKRQRRGNVWKFGGEAKVGGRLVAQATFAAVIVDK